MVIGKIIHCNPTARERFYLHLLLTSVKSPKSFEDLHTIDGVCHPSFQAACLALGLLDDDQEWVTCFTESITYATGSQLHWLFVIALIFGGISNPMALWTQFQENICDDLNHQLQQRQITLPASLTDPHLDYRLYLISQALSDQSQSLTDFNLPSAIFN